MAHCTDNPRLGIIGCGAKYGGELQHSVARVEWSEQPDGRAHITGTVGQMDLLWKGGALRHPDTTDGKLRLVDGRLRYPPPDGWITAAWRASSDENGSGVSEQQAEHDR